jgi:hypothetical protein
LVHASFPANQGNFAASQVRLFHSP